MYYTYVHIVRQNQGLRVRRDGNIIFVYFFQRYMRTYVYTNAPCIRATLLVPCLRLRRPNFRYVVFVFEYIRAKKVRANSGLCKMTMDTFAVYECSSFGKYIYFTLLYIYTLCITTFL